MMTMMPMIMRRMKHRMSLSVAMRRINARIYKRQGGGGGDQRKLRERCVRVTHYFVSAL